MNEYDITVEDFFQEGDVHDRNPKLIVINDKGEKIKLSFSNIQDVEELVAYTMTCVTIQLMLRNAMLQSIGAGPSALLTPEQVVNAVQSSAHLGMLKLTEILPGMIQRAYKASRIAAKGEEPEFLKGLTPIQRAEFDRLFGGAGEV